MDVYLWVIIIQNWMIFGGSFSSIFGLGTYLEADIEKYLKKGEGTVVCESRDENTWYRNVHLWASFWLFQVEYILAIGMFVNPALLTCMCMLLQAHISKVYAL